MKLSNVEFVTSAGAGGRTDGIPRDGIAQIAFAGRSNVGKSSLLNALCRQTIARTSAAPGKTRLANIFRVTAEGGAGGPGRWSVYFVDLPGYGYARGGADAAKELAGVAEAYVAAAGGERLRPERGAEGKRREAAPPSESEREPSAGATSERELRPALGVGPQRHQGKWGPASSEKSRQEARITESSVAVFHLIDSRHPGLESDRQAAAWFDSFGIVRHVVATKVDKLTRAERTRNLRELKRIFGTAALPVSAERGEGLDELWRVIASLARAREKPDRARP